MCKYYLTILLVFFMIRLIDIELYNDSPGGTSTSSKGKSPTTPPPEWAKVMSKHIRKSPDLNFIRSGFTSVSGLNSVKEVHGNGFNSLETVTGDLLLENRGSDEVVGTFVENDGLGKVALKPGQDEEPLIHGVVQSLREKLEVRVKDLVYDPHFNLIKLGHA